MRARLKGLRQLIALILGRLQLGLGRILEVILRVWHRLNAVEIPLSPLQWILLFYIIFGIRIYCRDTRFRGQRRVVALRLFAIHPRDRRAADTGL